jgi:hypothetical protein
MANSEGKKETQAKLYKLIDGMGGPDKYVDLREEREVFKKAEALGIGRDQAEAMLHHRCKTHKWTRESEITYYLRVMLEKTCDRDGAISKDQFDRIVGFAVAVRMPRKDAIRTCCKIVREAGWRTRVEGMIKKHDWFAEYEDRA